MTREDQLEELFVFGLLRKIRPTISASQLHRLLRAGQRYSASSASGTFLPFFLLAESNTPSHIWQLLITHNEKGELKALPPLAKSRDMRQRIAFAAGIAYAVWRRDEASGPSQLRSATFLKIERPGGAVNETR